MPNIHQDELLNFLLRSQDISPPTANLKPTLQQFVFEYGWWYEPVECPSGVEVGKPQECHTNAANLIVKNRSFVYCEGYALSKSGAFPIIHAWVTDGHGRAIDNTWPEPGVAYAGVPFQSVFVAMTSLKNRANISLLDDWQNRWPLRGELGDRPEEWLELAGKSLVPVSQHGKSE